MEKSSPSRSYSGLPSLLGVKRPATSAGLLPAFDPASSSPSSSPAAKRVARESPQTGKPLLPSLIDEAHQRVKYPSPFPTSETNILSSPPAGLTRRPPVQRTVSTLSQREPLASVPTAQLDSSGEPILFGRSGKSAHFQLHSASKNISRVHLRAAYVPSDPPQSARVEIVCMGWNGIKVHCQGKHWELQKEDSFSSESAGSDIMVDVADTRVVIQWPGIGRKADTPETSEDEAEALIDDSPSRRTARALRNRTPSSNAIRARLQSPISPKQEKTPPQSDPPAIQIYEDHDSENDQQGQANATFAANLKSSDQNEACESFLTQDFSDNDEENDPTVHSFGPMGANLLPQMASFCATSPEQARCALGPAKASSASPSHKRKADESSKEQKPDPPALVLDVSSHPTINHVVNQLAYSRLSKLPLSMMMNNLPAELKTKGDGRLDYDDLRGLIAAAPCIGEVPRLGKDAAGAPLESEYYYILDNDFDSNRKDTVRQLKKPGLRECRKQHKQYFWKKPKC